MSISVVLTAGPQRERAERALRCLASQTAADAVEEVVIADHAGDEARPIVFPPKLRVEAIDAGGMTLSAGRAVAFGRTSAPIVAMLEDHSYPVPGWAEALLEAHQASWGAVGFAMANANPEHWVSRGGLVTEYGRTMHPAPGGPVSSLPAHNVSYKRDALVLLAERLDVVLASDVEMAHAFEQRGLSMFLEPRAVVEHEFFWSLVHVCGVNFAHGRVIGGMRGRRWGRPRRLIWGVGTLVSAPVVRAVRLARALRDRRLAAWPAVAKALPVVATAFAGEALGESAGYLLGIGDAEAALATFELDVPRDSRRGRRFAPATVGHKLVRLGGG